MEHSRILRLGMGHHDGTHRYQCACVCKITFNRVSIAGWFCFLGACDKSANQHGVSPTFISAHQNRMGLPSVGV